MCPGQLGWTIIFLLILPCNSGYQDLTCYTDYIQTLTCFLQVDPGHAETFPDLTIEWNDAYEELEEFTNSCSFHRSTHNQTHMQYTCHMDVYKLMLDDEFNVTITDKLSNSSIEERHFHFILAQSIKPSPPFNVTVAYFGDYNISWKTLYEEPQYYALQNKLQYELRYKKQQDSWMTQTIRFISVDLKSVSLMSLELQKGSVYEIQVRAQPQPSSLCSGVWSEWSTSTFFQTQPVEEEKIDWFSWVFLISSPVAIFALLAGWKLTQRLWKKMWVLVPNPEHFFQPLYSAHEGNFKRWVGTPDNLNLFDWVPMYSDPVEVYLHCLPRGIKVIDVNEQSKGGNCGIFPPGPFQTEVESFALGSGEGKDKSYGHVSLNTVLVVDDKESGQLHCDCNHLAQDRIGDCDGDDNYPKINVDGDQPDGQVSNDMLLGKEDRIISSGHVSMERSGRIPMWPEVPNGSILETLCQHSPEDWDPGSPISLPSPEGDGAPFSQGPYAHFSCSSEKEAFGHPLVLDMDTFDSGFAGSDCGSPLENDFLGGSPVEREGTSALDTSHVEDDTPRSYVKQWVIFPSPSPGPGSHNS